MYLLQKRSKMRFQLQNTLSFYPYVGSYLLAKSFAKLLLQTTAVSWVLNTLSEAGEIGVVATVIRLSSDTAGTCRPGGRWL